MTCNLEVIARMAMNGWLMIPAEPGAKQTYCKWGAVTRDNYKFGSLFAGRPLDLNAAVLCDDLVSVVDFDAHGEAPNGVSVYRDLVYKHPEVFDGCIIEMTQSGGYHAYYRGVTGGTYKVEFDVDGGKVPVEVLCGRRLVYCWPTVTEKGPYNVFTDHNFFNTKPENLPGLPAAFNRPAGAKPTVDVKAAEPGDLTGADVEAAVQYYLNECRFNGAGRHDQARALARCLAGLGLREVEITRHVESFITGRGRELTDKKEAERISQYGLKHPLEGTPWRAITRERRARADRTLAKIMGGD